MKAVRLHRYGGPETLICEDGVAEPEVGADTVLIGSVATSVNPIDWKIRSGARQRDFPLDLPAILGRDVSGTVLAIGRDVRDFAVGDRVIAMAEATYAELVAVPAALVTRLPDGVDPVDAAALPLASLTGEQLVRTVIRVTAGQTVLVSGALGSVGRAAVHSARTLGARVIAAVRTRQLAQAERLDMFATVALDDEDAMARLGHVDAVADTVGGETAAALLRKVRPGGRFGYASVLPGGIVPHPSIEIGRVFVQPDAAVLRRLAEDVRDGRFVLPVGRHMPLHEAAAAHELAQKGGSGKIVLTVSGPPANGRTPRWR